MIVYHGSWLEVKKPDLKHSRSDVDFGKRILCDTSQKSGCEMVWKIQETWQTGDCYNL